MSRGSETWALVAENMRKLENNEGGIFRLICNIEVHDQLNATVLREKLRIRGIQWGMHEWRMLWF